MNSSPQFTQQFINFSRTKRNNTGSSQTRCNNAQTAVVNQLPANNDTNDASPPIQFFNCFPVNYSSLMPVEARAKRVAESTNEKVQPQPPVKRRIMRKPKKSKDNPPKENDMLNFPPEIFFNICKFLAPNDLISLSKVCKLYYNYLCSDSIGTQIVWKTSRKDHLEKLQLPPPEGMNERQYCTLFVERGCQICKKPRIRKVYWAFRVRCCRDCLKEHTKSEHRIIEELRISPVVLYGLSYVTHCFWTRWNGEFLVKFYWLSKVKEMEREYKALTPNERMRWANEMMIKGHKEMDDVNTRS